MNALANETSPYLRQHADNPVEWYPWSSFALNRARQEDKPILLSIGYSACHWCHVMAHESFEDEETAALMNRAYINIKVDREERPDLDKIYQIAHYLLTRRSGGWPLTMFLMPDDHLPFFGGTYFPKHTRYGLPAFQNVLHRVEEAYRTQRDAIREQNSEVLGLLNNTQMVASKSGDSITSQPLLEAYQQLSDAFDPRWGGFGGAPKFPHPLNIERLLRHYAATCRSGKPDKHALDMAVVTLRRMAEGGIYDQLGGGFSRYSVDDYWVIPHFEKMLYDNGPLLGLYSQCWQITREPLFGRLAVATADWVLRDMRAPEGGFYSSLDADSEGEEGKFYVWDRDEVRTLLKPDSYALFARHFGLDQPPNFEGRWHLRVVRSIAELAGETGLTEMEVQTAIDTASARLLAIRNQRVWPGRDEKILTSWNALMIKGMAQAGQILERHDYILAAEQALDFIRHTLWHDGRLLATYKDGKAHLNAYLDDYALLLDAILTLLQVRWRQADLHLAQLLAEVLLNQFEDKAKGGFFFTSHDHEQLIMRTKSWADEAMPAGAGVAAYALGRLGHLLAEPRYFNATEACLRAAWSAIEDYPSVHCALLLALEEYLQPPELIILRGSEVQVLGDWQARCQEYYAPRRLVFNLENTQDEGHSDLLGRFPAEGRVRAYLCQGTTCQAPIEDFQRLERELAGSEVHGGTCC